MKSFLISILIILGLGLNSKAQLDKMSDSSLIVLPTLNNVLNAALNHSPLLKAKDMEYRIIEQEKKIEKKKWSDFVYFDGSTNYGLFDQVVLAVSSTENTTNTGLITKNEQIRYYAGISIKIPLSSFTSRRNQVNVKNLQLEQSNYEKQQLQEELRELVIQEYYLLKHFEESMKTFQSIYQTIQIAYMKAEKDVLNNNMEMNEFASLASTVGKAKNDYSKAKTEFYAQYYKLQNIAGVIFEKK